ncbi:EH signature domain-containing protein [Gemmatimonas sp.]|uniref:EH signature domain-containing protein n=1 Tax=Gemmatimonas sp. TaxID=1962908 RepID=UPI003F6F12FA
MKRLRLAAAMPMTGSLDHPLDPYQEIDGLRAGVEKIASLRANRPLRRATQSTIIAAMARWAECRPDVAALGARYIRALCAHAPMLEDEKFLLGISNHPEFPRRRRWLESLMGLYEGAWRPARHAEQIERMLNDALQRDEAQSARLDAIRPVASRYLSPNAAAFLSGEAVDQRIPIADVLARYGVPADTGLARAVANTAIRVWVAQLCKYIALSSKARALLEYGLSDLANSLAIDPGLLAEAIGRVIAWVPDEDEKTVAFVRDWLLDHPRFGDPRLPANQPKWAVMAAGPRERMIRWLAKGDLLFFFDFVMPRGRNPHGRKEFWLQYIDLVEDSAVALSPVDIARLRLSVTETLRYARADSTSGEVSAFIMRFGGKSKFVVAEFSQTGNAAYIHDAERFETLVGGMRARRYYVATTPNGLKSQTAMITKYSHLEGWEIRVHDELRHLGLRRRPLR